MQNITRKLKNQEIILMLWPIFFSGVVVISGLLAEEGYSIGLVFLQMISVSLVFVWYSINFYDSETVEWYDLLVMMSYYFKVRGGVAYCAVLPLTVGYITGNIKPEFTNGLFYGMALAVLFTDGGFWNNMRTYVSASREAIAEM